MGSLTFATSSGKEDIFGSFKAEESKQEAKQLEPLNLSQPKLVQMNSGGGSVGLFGLAKQAAPTEVKTLNAKKIDVNFDADDFFNSFQPATQQKQAEPKFSTKLQEVDDPFDIAAKPAKKA